MKIGCVQHDCDQCKAQVEEIERLNKQCEQDVLTIAKLQERANHWKANHANVVDRLRLATQRNDLNVDRIPAIKRMEELQEENAKLRAALTICADQFDAYAEHHKAKMEDYTNGTVYQEDAEVKWHRNQLLAFNAREALK